MTKAALRSLALAAAGAAAAPSASSQEPPWEVWRDLARLAEIVPGERGLLRSSHCPSGCGQDRHEPGDWRYIRLDGDEGVVFEETGPGAITRIWMTMGEGASQPLDPDIRIRIYVDEAAAPVVDLPLPEMFAGRRAPFLPPLVVDRTLASGGNVSYVPIPYRSGCRVSLLGAHDKKIWFQFSSRRLASPDGVTSFTGREDLSAWTALLSAPGEDPWPPSPSAIVTTGEVRLGPGESATLLDVPGPDSVTALRLEAPARAWALVELQADFDGEARLRLPLADFFAVGAGGRRPTRSLLVGLGKDGALYSWFPMPFFHAARVRLRSLAASGEPPVALSYAIRRAGAAPRPESGLFGAALGVSDATPTGQDFPLLDLEGEGRWVGLFAELGSVGTLSRAYLEGDERVFLDDSRHPQAYGTGVEDLFGGGFYFDAGPFGRALHGSPYHLLLPGSDVTAAYRLMLTDAVPFARRIHAGLEGGHTGEVSMRARTVAFYYLRRGTGLVERDLFDVALAGSREDHCYSTDGPQTVKPLTGAFEGEPPVPLAGAALYRPPGVAHFVLRGATGPRLRIRRRFDAGWAWQRADVFVNGHYAGAFPPSEANSFRRWRETDLDLPGAEGDLSVSVVSLPDPISGTVPFTEAAYELWSSPGPVPAPAPFAGCVETE